MRLFQQNRAVYTMPGRGSTIFSERVVFHSVSHTQVALPHQLSLAAPGLSEKQHFCELELSSSLGFTHPQMRSPPSPHSKDQALAPGQESWITSQSLGMFSTHSKDGREWGDLCGENIWGIREGTQGGEESLRVQRSPWRREQLPRAAATAAAHQESPLPDTAQQVLDIYYLL